MHASGLTLALSILFAAPAAGASVWEAEPNNATIRVRTEVHGVAIEAVFERVCATVVFNEYTGIPTSLVFIVQTEPVSPTTDLFDEIIRSAPLLDVEHHPRIYFRSTQVRAMVKAKQPVYIVSGELTMRGVTRPVALELAVSKSQAFQPGPWWRRVRAFATVSLADFQMIGTDELAADTVTFDFDLELTPQRRYQVRGGGYR